MAISIEIVICYHDTTSRTSPVMEAYNGSILALAVVTLFLFSD